MTDTASVPPAPPKETEREIAFEHLISGRLALQVLRNQIDTQIVGLRAQLAIAESHMKRTVQMLEQTEAKLSRQHPEYFALMVENLEPGSRRQRR
jgi:hypothetical protein